MMWGNIWQFSFNRRQLPACFVYELSMQNISISELCITLAKAPPRNGTSTEEKHKWGAGIFISSIGTDQCWPWADHLEHYPQLILQFYHSGCLILVHILLHWIHQCWITLVTEFSTDHSTNSILALSCLGQHKECGEVPILLIPGVFGVVEVLMYSGWKARPNSLQQGLQLSFS